MSTGIGSLEIQLLANLAQLRADMGSATGIVASASQKMSNGFGVVSKALGAIGVGLSAAAFASWIKGAIDAGDEMKAFSQKTGVAVKDVAGLQLAFKQGGIESQAMGASLARMTKEMAKGNDAFDALGVSTRNADGSLRGAKDVLYDTADALASVKGDTERSALAMEIFGKSGAELLPVFADGSEGLRDMAEMADKLGLSLDGEAADAADKFNDTLELVGMSTQGVGRQVAAYLLPALNGIVGAFLDFITEGDRVKKMADFIATGLKLLYSAGVALVEVFNTVGKTVGASMAAIVKVMQGDFKGALAVGKEWVADMKTNWTKTIENIGDAWEGTSADTTKALASVGRSMRAVKLDTDAAKESQKAAAKQQREDAKEAEKLAKEREKLLQAEIDLMSKRGLAAIAAYEAEEAAIDAALGKAREMVAGIDAQTAALTMSSTEREISNALLALEKTGLEKGTYAYEEYAAQIRAAIVNRDTVAQSIEQSKAIAENWTNLTKEIGQGLTDSLFRAFEAGKGFFSTLWDGIRNTFKTTALRLVINAVMNPVNAAVGGLLGAGSTAAQAAGGAGGLGGIGSLLGGLNGLGGMFGAGTSMSLAGGFGTAMSTAGSLMGAGSIGGGLAVGAGAVAPYAMAAAALYGLFKSLKHERTPHSGGAATATSAGGAGATWADVTGLAQRNFDRTDSGTEGMIALSRSVAAVLQPLADLTNAGRISVGTAFADDKSKDESWGAFRASLGGKDLADWDGTRYFADGEKGVKEFAQAIADSTRDAIDRMKLPEWARDITDALGDGATLEQIAAAVEAITATKDALAALSTDIGPLGGVFERIASLSEDARVELAGFAGGIDALREKIGGYVSSFYSEGEQAAFSATNILSTLKAAGITSAGSFDDRGDFRALVDSLDVSTTTGRQQLATLLDVADDFAALTKYMEDAGLTLGEVAKGVAPGVIEKVVAAAAAGDGAAADGAATGAAGGIDYSAQTASSLTAISDKVEDMGERIEAALAKLQPLLTAISSSSAAAARQLAAWDDGGAITTTPAT